MTTIHIEQGDITDCAVDAIVNAANNDLVLGAGVAGAIRRRGGPSIQAECDRISPIEVGQAAITGGGDLPARYVIHAGSMGLGSATTERSLTDSINASFDIAEDKELKSIAFPAVGTGVAGFSTRRCAQIMLGIARERAERGTPLTDIYFILYDKRSYDVFIDEYNAGPSSGR